MSWGFHSCEKRFRLVNDVKILESTIERVVIEEESDPIGGRFILIHNNRQVRGRTPIYAWAICGAHFDLESGTHLAGELSGISIDSAFLASILSL